MFTKKIDFDKIFSLVEAAQKLDEADEEDKAKEVLLSLADKIKGELDE